MSESSTTTVCANIGARERRQRLALGIVLFLVADVALVALVATQAPRGYRALLFVPWLIGAFGVFQAAKRTCVALAATGERSFEGVRERIPEADRRAIRSQATSIYIGSFFTAAGLTLVSLLF